MRTLAHISDLHFGKTDPAVVAALLRDLCDRKPDLIVISGDLTQRAYAWQFKAARAFLDRLPAPYLVVPGNHDIPLYNVFARAVSPLRAYRRHISEELCPFRADDEVAVMGINTARHYVWKEGHISAGQIERLRRSFAELPDHVFKVVFTHHPFLPPPDQPETRIVGRARSALSVLESAGVDLLLAGHLHRAYRGDVMTHHTHVERSILVAQASTATSTRLREEPNAYNLITIDPPTVRFVVHSWEGAAFVPGLAETYVKTPERRWRLTEQDPGLNPTARRA